MQLTQCHYKWIIYDPIKMNKCTNFSFDCLNWRVGTFPMIYKMCENLISDDTFIRFCLFCYCLYFGQQVERIKVCMHMHEWQRFVAYAEKKNYDNVRVLCHMFSLTGVSSSQMWWPMFVVAVFICFIFVAKEMRFKSRSLTFHINVLWWRFSVEKQCQRYS